MNLPFQLIFSNQKTQYGLVHGDLEGFRTRRARFTEVSTLGKASTREAGVQASEGNTRAVSFAVPLETAEDARPKDLAGRTASSEAFWLPQG
jgi:hypothetical protein